MQRRGRQMQRAAVRRRVMLSRAVTEPIPRRAPRAGWLVLPAILVLAAACSPPGGSRQPDVVLVVVDTLRADHLTQYGYGRATSVGIDGFTADATVFTRAYSTSSWTVPSVASLLTGLLPTRHGLVRQSAVLPDELTTLAETLSAAGWRSAGFSGNVFVGTRTGFDQGFEHFSGHDRGVLAYPDVSAMLEQVEGWLRGLSDPREPVFLYFQPMNCHGPYRVPEERRADLLGRPPSDRFDYHGAPMKAILKGDVAARAQVTPDVVESLVEKYDSAVRYSLDAVAELLGHLRAAGKYENSLVIVTADHGEELFDHGGFSHAYSLFEEVVRIPLWIKLPRQTEGSVVDQPVSLADLVPTILEVVDLVQPLDLDGDSLLPLLGENADSSDFDRRPLAFDTRWKRRAVASAILLGPYKLIEIESDYEGRRDVRLLFDLERDPSERHDLARSDPRTAAALSARLRRLREGVAPASEATVVELEAEALEALGYVD
jgi:arylsulfatase A-like enzyme